MRSTIMTTIALAACMSSPPAAFATQTSVDYDTGRQRGASLGAGVLGAGLGFGIGTLVGVGGFIALGGSGHVVPPGAWVIALGSMVGGTLGGGVWAASSGALWTGGPRESEDTRDAAWTGAWVGGVTGLLAGVTLVSTTIASGHANTPVLGLDGLGASALGGALLVGVGAGLGASFGYEDAYPILLDTLVVSPRFGMDHIGMKIEFGF